MGSDVAQATQQLGKMELDGNKLQTGEQVHEHLFQSGNVKIPKGWIQIV